MYQYYSFSACLRPTWVIFQCKKYMKRFLTLNLIILSIPIVCSEIYLSCSLRHVIKGGVLCTLPFLQTSYLRRRSIHKIYAQTHTHTTTKQSPINIKNAWFRRQGFSPLLSLSLTLAFIIFSLYFYSLSISFLSNIFLFISLFSVVYLYKSTDKLQTITYLFNFNRLILL